MQKPVTHRKDVRLRLTAYGVLFVFVVAVMTLGSLNYNSNLGLLLAFLLGGMAAVSLLHTYRNLAGIQILAANARPVFAGEIAVFDLLVCAAVPARRAVSFSFPPSPEPCQDRITAEPWRLSVRIPADKRGWFDPGPLQIQTRYPFGIFRATTPVLLGINCLVYPKPISGPSAPDQNAAPAAGEGVKELPGIGDFKGLQPYLPGEPVEHIYWKAFSRGQGLQIKQFVEPAGATLVFDWNSVKGINVEHKLSRLCDLVLKAHRFNLNYGLNLPGNSIPPAAGHAHRQNCLKALALFRPAGTPP